MTTLRRRNGKVPLSAVLAGALVLASAAPLAAVAGPEFLAYEGKNSVHEGQGGEKKVVDGVDFWMDGTPPRRFQVLGVLNDRRHQSGLIGAIRMSTLNEDIAKAAKAAGGDAVILESEDTDVIGVVGGSSTTFNGQSTAYSNGNFSNGSFGGTAETSTYAHSIRKHDSRWVVARYLPDDPPAVAPAAATAAPQAEQPTAPH